MKNLLYIFALAGILSACNMPNNQMNEKAAKNEARLQQFYDQVMNAHNPDAVDSFCTADFVDHQPSPGHTGKGVDDLKAQLKEFFAMYPDIHFKTDFIASKGDTVISKVMVTGTNTGSISPSMPATNKAVNFEASDFIVLKDGKATDRWGYSEEMKMLTQLGMMGGPAPKGENMEGEKKDHKTDKK